MKFQVRHWLEGLRVDGYSVDVAGSVNRDQPLGHVVPDRVDVAVHGLAPATAAWCLRRHEVAGRYSRGDFGRQELFAAVRTHNAAAGRPSVVASEQPPGSYATPV